MNPIIPIPFGQILLPHPELLYGRLSIECQLHNCPFIFFRFLHCWLVHRFLLYLPDGKGRPVKNSQLCCFILNLVITFLQLPGRRRRQRQWWHEHSETKSRLGTYFTPARVDNSQRRLSALTQVRRTTSPQTAVVRNGKCINQITEPIYSQVPWVHLHFPFHLKGLLSW